MRRCVQTSDSTGILIMTARFHIINKMLGSFRLASGISLSQTAVASLLARFKDRRKAVWKGSTDKISSFILLPVLKSLGKHFDIYARKKYLSRFLSLAWLSPEGTGQRSSTLPPQPLQLCWFTDKEEKWEVGQPWWLCLGEAAREVDILPGQERTALGVNESDPGGPVSYTG